MTMDIWHAVMEFVPCEFVVPLSSDFVGVATRARTIVRSLMSAYPCEIALLVLALAQTPPFLFVASEKCRTNGYYLQRALSLHTLRTTKCKCNQVTATSCTEDQSRGRRRAGLHAKSVDRVNRKLRIDERSPREVPWPCTAITVSDRNRSWTH